MVEWREIARRRADWDAGAALLERYGVSFREDAESFLEAVAQVFRRLPYENLTKLQRKFTMPPGLERLRMPSDVVSEHLEYGAGGTCFSLATVFGTALGRHGLAVYPVLARMRTVRALHCGLVAPIGRERFLLDPGYLVLRPIRLEPGRTNRVETQTGTVEVRGLPDGTYELWTNGVWRYRFRDEPLDTQRFLDLWQDSFDWVMMHQIHVSFALDGGYVYLHGHRMRLVRQGRKENLNVRENLTQELAQRFGLDPGLVESTVAILDRARKKGLGPDKVPALELAGALDSDMVGGGQ